MHHVLAILTHTGKNQTVYSRTAVLQSIQSIMNSPNSSSEAQPAQNG